MTDREENPLYGFVEGLEGCLTPVWNNLPTVGWLLLAAAFFYGAIARMDDRGYYDPDPAFPLLGVRRFHTDNAPAASANALEFIAQKVDRERDGAVWFLGGLLVLVLWSLGRLRRAIQELGADLATATPESRPKPPRPANPPARPPPT